jgi:predicted Zn-dependent protease
MDKKGLKISENTLKEIESVLANITDQTIIASSRIIEGASIRPRLRVMAEVHTEGNPHSSYYPEIVENSFNLILKDEPQISEVKKEISQRIPEIRIFTIHHKRNGPHVVFQFRFTPQET